MSLCFPSEIEGKKSAQHVEGDTVFVGEGCDSSYWRSSGAQVIAINKEQVEVTRKASQEFSMRTVLLAK